MISRRNSGVGLRGILAIVTTVLLCCVPGSTLAAMTPAQLREGLADSLLLVNGYKGNSLVAQGTGVVVLSDAFNGYVLINAALLRRSESYTVRVPGSQAELVAQLLLIDPDSQAALLKVNGLAARAIPFGLDALSPGDNVLSAFKRSDSLQVVLSSGVVRQAVIAGSSATNNSANRLSHDARVDATDVSSFLINDCGELVGMNEFVDEARFTTLAVNLSALVTLTARQQLNILRAPATCLSAVAEAQLQAQSAAVSAVQAQQDARQAGLKAQALEKQLLASDQRNAALRTQTKIVGERADQALMAVRRADEHAAHALRELEEKNRLMLAETQAVLRSFEAESDKTQASLRESLQAQKVAARERDQVQLVTFILLGIACLGLMVMALVVLRADRRQYLASGVAAAGGKDQASVLLEADAAPRNMSAAEYVLDGVDDKGVHYNLKVPGKQLRTENGIVIGRNPEGSPYIINHADVSRKHARMRLMQDRIFIEDLGSTNGTSVNGQSIDDRGPTSVSSGDQIIIGSVVMKLQVVGA